MCQMSSPDCQIVLPEVRTILEPTILFWARFEGQNLFHIADKWRCCWVTSEFVDKCSASLGNSPLPRPQSQLGKGWMHMSCVRADFYWKINSWLNKCSEQKKSGLVIFFLLLKRSEQCRCFCLSWNVSDVCVVLHSYYSCNLIILWNLI